MLFFHLPTFQLTNHSPELILAIMAAGAQYRFEYQNAAKFFQASKIIVTSRLQAYDIQRPGVCTASNGGSSTTAFEELEIIRCLLILMGFATWQETAMLREALHLRNLLIETLRRSGLDEPNMPLPPESMDWLRWVEQESTRRAKLAAFGFIDIYSIA